MKPTRISNHRRRGGWMNVDLLVAIALVMLAVLPLAYGLVGERRLLDAELRHAALVELLDGELEVLLAGDWTTRPEGESDIPLTGAGAMNLAAGRCVLVKTGNHLRLEWRSEKHNGGVSVTKEAIAR
jgi:hypothetical protein